MSDYYKILGIDRDASADEIKKAYRKKAVEFHPDTNQDDPTAEDKFKKVSEAYDVLKDPQKKSNYDMFGDADGRPNMGGASAHGFGGDAGDFNDIINEFMRAQGAQRHGAHGFHFDFGQRRQQPAQNPDLLSSMDISLEDAYNGTTATVELTEPDGNTKNINITIPPGSKHEMTLRLRGKGYQHDKNLPAGDLHITLNIIPHHLFAVIGMDIMMEKTISMIDAVLGKEIEVQLLNGKSIKVSIPEGTQPNQKIRLKGKGMTGLNNTNVHGDLYIKINVEIPTNLNEQQKQLLRDL